MGCACMKGARARDEAAFRNSLPETMEQTLKILVLGDRGVGKTAFVTRVVKNFFLDAPKPSTKISIHTKSLKPFSDVYAYTQLWDIPGQEGVDLTETSFSGVHGVILIFSLTNRESLANLYEWHHKICRYFPSEENPGSSGIPVLLLANKLDDEINREVSDVEVADVARLLNVYEWDQVSIKADTHIYSVYKELVKGVVKNIRNGYEAKYFEQQAAPIFEKPVAAEDLGYAGVGRSIIFGVELEEVDKTPDGLPIVIEDILKYLVEHGPPVPNIFQIPGSERECKRLRKAANDHGHLGELSYYNEVHVVASLLKDFLRELPEPLIPTDFNDVILETMDACETHIDLAVAMVDIIRELPEDHLVLLQAVLEVLFVVSEKDHVNSMTSAHLASIFAPLVMRFHGLEMGRNNQYLKAQQTTACVQFLIDNTPDIFAQIEELNEEEADREEFEDEEDFGDSRMMGIAPGGGSSRRRRSGGMYKLESGRRGGNTSRSRSSQNSLSEGLV